MDIFKIATLLIVLSVAGFSQNTSTTAASSTDSNNPPPKSTPAVLNGVTVYSVCGPKNPPPCASVPPKVKYSPDPEYTREAARIKFRGSALYEVVVGIDGRIMDIKQDRRVGYGLDETGIHALKRWKFTPGTMDGKPVAALIKIEIEFRSR
jgi:TonB family protein